MNLIFVKLKYLPRVSYNAFTLREPNQYCSLLTCADRVKIYSDMSDELSLGIANTIQQCQTDQANVNSSA